MGTHLFGSPCTYVTLNRKATHWFAW